MQFSKSSIFVNDNHELGESANGYSVMLLSVSQVNQVRYNIPLYATLVGKL